ncbi:hypothetical protein GIY30_21040 [Gordonia sp. HNM0687]|uniref:Uncharacterized protein n=1 Tax=Gordonia mangrovi TaxID=2665643 RepID=A0A6L7GWH7_9ACTN|nr:hypothetical protein [Gordonia mangrovi]MXP23827.1 hypothetical protein [Gordonia mangrovi]UVF76384.1 hypothetical protein NWF22_13445 [Gordonia mangrovi]
MKGFVRLVAVLVAGLALIAVLAGCNGSEEERPAGAALPQDFPVAQVPLVEGTVLTADGTRADGWAVTVQGVAADGNILDSAVTTLTDAGFTESQRTTEGGQRVVILSATKDSTDYWVQVGSTPGAAGGPGSVFYQVSVE